MAKYSVLRERMGLRRVLRNKINSFIFNYQQLLRTVNLHLKQVDESEASEFHKKMYSVTRETQRDSFEVFIHELKQLKELTNSNTELSTPPLFFTSRQLEKLQDRADNMRWLLDELSYATDERNSEEFRLEHAENLADRTDLHHFICEVREIFRDVANAISDEAMRRATDE